MARVRRPDRRERRRPAAARAPGALPEPQPDGARAGLRRRRASRRPAPGRTSSSRRSTTRAPTRSSSTATSSRRCCAPGDMLIVSPKSSVRRHDRVLLPPPSGRGRARRPAAAHGAADHARPFRRPDDERAIDAVDARLDRPDPLDQPIEKVAAGEPAATSTGRHHNVREEEPSPNLARPPWRRHQIGPSSPITLVVGP